MKLQPTKRMARPVMKEDGWWLVDTPKGVDEMGPFKNEEAVTLALRGLEKFLKHCGERGYITSLEDGRAVVIKRGKKSFKPPEPDRPPEPVKGGVKLL